MCLFIHGRISQGMICSRLGHIWLLNAAYAEKLFKAEPQFKAALLASFRRGGHTKKQRTYFAHDYDIFEN